jgi:hypothetical protein
MFRWNRFSYIDLFKDRIAMIEAWRNNSENGLSDSGNGFKELEVEAERESVGNIL